MGFRGRSGTSAIGIQRCLLQVFFITVFALAPTSLASDISIRAFPGAEGFGAGTPGGRGGKVTYVSTLEDYLPGKESPITGSLRAAVDADGPRIVLFRVSGTISLKADLWVQKPFITIAGQTSPGGICLKDYQFVLATHDVIVRHMRFRPGDLTKKEQMAVGIFGARNCILDHCSMTWAIDEVMSSFGAREITAQWCIISEGLSHSYHPKGEHSKGSIIDGTGGITIHHSLYAHNAARNPRVNTVVLDFRNNVLYDWGYRAAYTTEAPSYVNWVGNYLKPGPSTQKSAHTKIFDPGDDMPRVYFSDNFLEGFPAETADNSLFIYPLVKEDAKEFREMMVVPGPFKAPLVVTDAPVTALNRVLAEAGATLPARDAADVRLMNEVRSGNGKIIDSPAQVGGWPTFEAGAPPIDGDFDGMPDEFEKRYAFDAANSNDGTSDSDADGYPNVEEYLNSTDPRSPESDSKLNAAEFTAILESARKMSKDGLHEFQVRESGQNELRRERNDRAAKSAVITFTPPIESNADSIVVDINGKATLEMVRIPAGSFVMGTPENEDGEPRERPQHKVYISKPFYLCNTKTTTRQFTALLGPESRDLTTENAELPAKEVTWFEATEFCETLAKATGQEFRLPSEAEWEYACRAGTTTAFSTGDKISTDQANFDGAVVSPLNPVGVCRGKLTPSKMFPPNPWGLYDMHGNQAEYCIDVAFRKYTSDEITDPVYLGDGGARVLRGGKATSKALYIRSGYRYCYTPGVGYAFRVLMEVPRAKVAR
jgi:formylglycine-generating enzyme required for sulfatase activity/pectate lyase